MLPCLRLAPVLLLAAPASADVLVVDPEGYGDHLDVQSAIDAASDGDLLLVRLADNPFEVQPGFTITGKSLTVRGLPGPILPLGSAVVRDIPAGGTVVLEHLDLNWPSGEDTAGLPGLRIEASTGAVRLVDCRVHGSNVTAGAPGMRLVDARNVALVDCEVVGGTMIDGSAGVQAVRSRLAVFGGSIAGGPGHDDLEFHADAFGGDGGSGAVLDAQSLLWIAGSTIRGGDGGDAACATGCTAVGGDGGTGLEVSSDSTAVLLDTSLDGGSLGLGETGNGEPGADLVGDAHLLSGEPAKMSAPDTVDEGVSARVVLEGQPGERVVLLVAESGAFSLLGFRSGVRLVGSAIPGWPQEVGVIPASGVLEVDVDLPVTPDGVEATFLLQAIFVQAPGPARLGPVRAVSVLGPRAPVFGEGVRVYVDADAAAGGNGRSWARAFRHPQEALHAMAWSVNIPSEVWIAEGTYTLAPPGSSPSIVLYLRSGVHVYGGFAGGEADVDERDPSAHPVVLSADLLGNDGPGFSNRADNSGSVCFAGYAAFPGTVLPSTDMLLDGVTVSGSEANNWGGQAAVMSRGDLTLHEVRFLDNRGTFRSGAVDSQSGALVASRCTFIGNLGDSGGGMRLSSAPPSTPRIVSDCLFAGNRATMGAGLFATGRIEVRNCHFYANDGSGPGSAVYLEASNHIYVYDTLIWANRRSGSEDFYTQLWVSGGVLDVRYTCLQGWNGSFGGTGNHGLDPLFLDPLGPDGIAGTLDDDLRLAEGSPCVDAGDTGLVLPSQVLDLAGNARVLDDPGTTDTGAGGPPVVDMGAYER